MLNTSTKVRRTADGRRFLVIPFRHNTPGNDAHAGAMPASVYSLAKGLQASKVVGQGTRPVGQVTHLSARTGMHPAPASKQTGFLTSLKSRQAAQTVARKYGWAGRLSAAALKAAGHDAAQVRRYQGMVKFAMPSGKQGAYSGYVAFRVMVEGSPGWIVPARPGQYIAQRAAADAQGAVADILRAALKA